MRIANAAQAWDEGVRSFVKAVFSANQKSPKQTKAQPTKQKKRKDPTLLQKQVLGIGKAIALYCAAVVNLAFAGVVIPYKALDLHNFPFSHFLTCPNFPKNRSMELEYLHPHGISLTKKVEIASPAWFAKHTESPEWEMMDEGESWTKLQV